MADPQPAEGDKGKKAPWYRFPIWTHVKDKLNVAGARFRDTFETDIRTMRVFVDLRNELDFGAIKNHNRRMPEIEEAWDGIDGNDKSKKESAGGIRDEIIDLYTKDGDAKSSIGPFTDEGALREEIDWVTKGTGYYDERNDPDYRTHEWKNSFTFEKFGQRIKCKFTVPAEKEVIYNDGRRYTLAFFGYNNPDYWTTLESDVRKIMKQVKDVYYANTTPGSGSRRNFDQNIDRIESSIVTMINSSNKWITEEFEEGKHFKNISGSGGVENLYKQVVKFKGELFKKRLTFDQMYYVHTYHVIKPEIYKNGRLYRLRDVTGWYKRSDEVDHGLDKNGWPLEVGDGSTVFENGPLQKGIVLLDLYNKNDTEYLSLQGIPKIRTVPADFISEWSLIDVAVWIYVSYDAYRDDLRDSRHHDEAISVMELILADIKVKDMEFEIPPDLETQPITKKNKHVTTKMELNKKVDWGKLRYSDDPDNVEVTLKPSQLNPAFDVRAFQMFPKSGVSKHLGRKLYYDVQDNVEKSKEPTISTRGAALYILHRIIERAKYWDGKGEQTGVIQLIEELSKEIGGWDIGPNLGPNFSRWGKPLTKNPFRPQQSS